jgi:hypothetical protein
LPPIETVTVTGYAVAQGAVVVGGLQVQGQAQSVKQGVTTSDLIPGGALVEREVPNTLDGLTVIRLALRAPDFGGIAMGSGQDAQGDRLRCANPGRNSVSEASDGEWLLPASWWLQHRLTIRIRNGPAELSMAAGAFYRV